MINVKVYHVGEIMTNCSYLVDEATGKSAVVDPGGRSEKLISQIKSDGGALEYVLLTHGHYDHIEFAKQLADMFGAKIVTGKENDRFLSDPSLNLTAKHFIDMPPFSADITLGDGDKFKLGETEITYYYTPGHTSGCGVFVFDDIMICGDVLFCESCGRTDLPTGDDYIITQSLKRLKHFEGDYTVIPGHGPMTTLEHERRFNPYMRGL